jgi:hypothetical protein
MPDPSYIEDQSELDAYEGPACMLLVTGSKVILGLECATAVAAMHGHEEWGVVTGKKLDDCYVHADERGVDQWHYYEAGEQLWVSARSIALVCEVDAEPHKHERPSLF